MRESLDERHAELTASRMAYLCLRSVSMGRSSSVLQGALREGPIIPSTRRHTQAPSPEAELLALLPRMSTLTVEV